MVTSMYGRDTCFPSMTTSIGLPTSGDIISMDDTNWELMLPSMTILSPFTGPLIVMVALPPSEAHLAPHPSSAFSSGPIGLLLMDSSPVIVVSESKRAASPVMSLMVVPEFRTSIVLSGAWSLEVSTESPPSIGSMTAPMDLIASAVAFVSKDSRGFLTEHLPSDSAAIIIALWV